MTPLLALMVLQAAVAAPAPVVHASADDCAIIVTIGRHVSTSAVSRPCPLDAFTCPRNRMRSRTALQRRMRKAHAALGRHADASVTAGLS